jgi:putative sigma-54 modulation protein
MQTSVTFKNLDSSENLKSYVRDKLDRFDKYLDNPAEATVKLLVEKHRHIAEINIFGDRLNLMGKEETIDMYSAIDLALDKLEKQIKKSKEKIRERRTASKVPVKEIIAEKTTISEETSERELKVKNIEYKPMDIEEATMQMDLVKDNFLVFTNAKTDEVNVLYRRKDGHYGLIQPNK